MVIIFHLFQLAFLLPIFNKLIATDNVDNVTASESIQEAEPRAIIIVPTRELAIQIYDQARKLAFGLLSAILVHLSIDHFII